MDREEGYELWAEAREMGRIEYRRIGVGETKMIWQNGKMDREEGDEIWAEAREMGCIEYRQIGMGRQKRYDKTEIWIVRRGTNYGQRPGGCAESRVD